MPQPQIQFLKDLDFKDKRVFMRLDLNVPIKDQKILDTYRIKKSLQSIHYLMDRGAKLLLASHLGRPQGKKDPKLSLLPIAEFLKKDLEVFFIEEACNDAPKHLLPNLKKQQIILLENLRFHPGESKQDLDFAKHLASYTDIYVNEAFSISHREHTSITLLPQCCKYRALGLQFESEIHNLDLIKNQDKPGSFVVLLGGSKLKDKIPLIESLIDQTDCFLIAGLMAYSFLHVMGVNVGNSEIETSCLSQVKTIINRCRERGKHIVLPIDHVVELDGQVQIIDSQSIPHRAIGRDIGPRTIQQFQERIQASQSVFWNGPVGFFEKQEFAKGTQIIAKIIAQHKQAYRVVGGGHSALAVREFEQDINHISTGGGASLAYLQGSVLPGIKSITSNVLKQSL